MIEEREGETVHNMSARVILKLVVLLCVVGVVIAVMQDNAYAASAWLVAIMLTIGWLTEMDYVDVANEDARFWRGEFVKAQVRYATRTIPELDEPEPAKPDEVNADGKK